MRSRRPLDDASDHHDDLHPRLRQGALSTRMGLTPPQEPLSTWAPTIASLRGRDVGYIDLSILEGGAVAMMKGALVRSIAKKVDESRKGDVLLHFGDSYSLRKWFGLVNKSASLLCDSCLQTNSLRGRHGLGRKNEVEGNGSCV